MLAKQTLIVLMVLENELHNVELAQLRQYNTHITAMVDKPCLVSLLGGINNIILAHPEHVGASNTSCIVPLLSVV